MSTEDDNEKVMTFYDDLEEIGRLMSRLGRELPEIGRRGLLHIDRAADDLDSLEAELGEQQQALLREFLNVARSMFAGLAEAPPSLDDEGQKMAELAELLRKRDEAAIELLAALITARTAVN
jgi:hypothetical protein